MKIITFSLIASQTVAPLYSKEFSQDINSQLIAFWGKEVSRVYCSSKSLGFDLHFNKKTGELYSFNEFSNKLEPFRIESEIPFKDIIPKKGIDDFLREWSDNQIKIDTNIRKDELLIKEGLTVKKFQNEVDLEKYVIALGGKFWSKVLEYGSQRTLFSQSDWSLLSRASAIPNKIPSSKKEYQKLLKLLERVENNGFIKP